MKKCLTKKLLFSEVSGCLVEKPECCYAHKIGFSIECRHPEHTKFHADTAGVMSQDEMRELYDALRRKRREEFVVNLDETGRSYFSFRNDFFGQQPSDLDMN